jgi:serine/threonine-protein kinase
VGDARKVCPSCGAECDATASFCPRDGAELHLKGETEPLVGELLGGRYRVLQRLGTGGMGRVYMAEHLAMGRRDAIKIMSPELARDPDAVRRFQREAQNASRIKHGNVATIYDYGETGTGTYFIAMELVEGETLSSLLRREGVLPIARAVEIAVQIADALRAAHRLDPPLIHRDLKPDNIMLARDSDGRDVVKVVDFGIAKAMTGQNVTATGTAIGSPAYMSPEQISGKDSDARSDVYGLGCVLYESLTGTCAFPHTTLESIAAHKFGGDAPRPSALSKDLPRALDDLVARSLSRSPDARFATAAEMREALLFAARAVGAEPVAEPPRAQVPMRQSWVVAGGGALSVVLAALAWLAWQGTGDRRMNATNGVAVEPESVVIYPQQSTFRPLREELATARGALARGDYLSAGRSFTMLRDTLVVLARRYPNSAELLALGNEVAEVVRDAREACDAERAIVLRRGGDVPECEAIP